MMKLIQIVFVVALLPIPAHAEKLFIHRWFDIMKRDPDSGEASIYWEGHTTANGEPFRPYHVDAKGRSTCAHRVEDFNTILRVTFGTKSIECRVNDRGPFHNRRVIDLTPPAASALGLSAKGFGFVKVERIEYPDAVTSRTSRRTPARSRNRVADIPRASKRNATRH